MFVAVHCDQTMVSADMLLCSCCRLYREFCASGPELGDIMDINESLF